MVNPAICNKLMILSENITSILQNVSHIIIRGGENNNDENNKIEENQFNSMGCSIKWKKP